MTEEHPPTMNERSARVLAACVSVTIAGAWTVSARWILPVLASGFVVRALWGPRYSILARISSAVAGRLWPARMVAAAPKRFAQAIGAACLTLSSFLTLFGYGALGWSLAALVGLFAALEAALGFCFGCWLYGRLATKGWMHPDVCIDCVRPTSSDKGSGGAPLPVSGRPVPSVRSAS
jgi:hypothetical protein